MRSRMPWALFALLLVAACREATAPEQVEYRPGEAGTVDHALCLLGFDAVPLREVTTGHHLVQATINGTSGSFVLDTGANVTVVDQAHARRFGISDTQGGLGGIVGGLAGGRRARQVSIDSFRVGPVDVRQGRIVTADLGQLLESLSRFTGTEVYGLVGQDVLTEHRAIVDVAGPMLYLMAEDREPAPVPAGQCGGDGEVQASEEP
jgi:clan AA aspartic protease (TIGR02281 family)